jgi:hypothetical protein
VTTFVLLIVSVTVVGICSHLLTADPADRQVQALRVELEAKDRLITALTQKLDAMEELSNEREKTLALYRKIVPGFDNSP